MHRFVALPAVLWLAATLCGCTHSTQRRAGGGATFRVPAAALSSPLVLIAYGDTRFTDPSETAASSAPARRALIDKIAAEHPQAIFMNGDLPWHGVSADYDEYRSETRVWRDEQLRVYPALGNHEFSKCAEAQCLELWWNAFAELRGRRWYSVALGDRFLAVLLDSDASLLAGSEQRVWLEQQFAQLGQVQVILIVMHHPPVADLQTTKSVDHNPRPNEQALAAYLEQIAPSLAARIVVSAGHIHNYERQQQGGIMYLVSGGGGARPYEIDRTAADLYQGTDFPNYHYVRMELKDGRLSAAMIRLADSDKAAPQTWEVRDRFEISLRP
jgi:acid phosphatase type 7